MIYGNAVMLGGGGGGLTATDAILRVQAPAGSTVTISKGAVSKSDLGHGNANDHTLYDYYFIIHQSQFDSVNPWTVTATLGGDSASDTVIIDAADEYNVELSYILLLYNEGDECVAASGGWEAKNRSTQYQASGGYITNGADSMYVKNVQGGSWAMVTKNAVPFQDYSSLHILAKSTEALSNNVGAYIASSFPASSFVLSQLASVGTSDYTEITIPLNNISTNKMAIQDEHAKGIYIKSVWLAP